MPLTLPPQDIYNDTAHRALHDLRQQHLFSEVEAEVNLAFMQLIIALGKYAYEQAKEEAASALLDKDYKVRPARTHARTGTGTRALTPPALVPPRAQLRLKQRNQQGQPQLPAARLEPLLTQRHLHLLGRVVDLSALLLPRLQHLLREDLRLVVERLETSDLTGVVEADVAVQVLQRTHARLSQHVPLEPFEATMARTNQSVAPTSLRSRIGAHVEREVAGDLLPNFVYNHTSRRFVRARVQRVAPPSRPHAPRLLLGARATHVALMRCVRTHRWFVGDPHMRALLRLLGPAGERLLWQLCCDEVDASVRGRGAGPGEERASVLPALAAVPASVNLPKPPAKPEQLPSAHPRRRRAALRRCDASPSLGPRCASRSLLPGRGDGGAPEVPSPAGAGLPAGAA